MKLSEQINKEIIAAMKAKEKLTLEALRAAKTAFTLAKTQDGANGELTDDAELKIVQKLVKQRKDAATIYKEQSRDDLYQKEMSEVDVLEKFLPAKMSVGELKAYLVELIRKEGAEGMKDMGKIMGVASKALAGKADGKEISQLVRELLN